MSILDTTRENETRLNHEVELASMPSMPSPTSDDVVAPARARRITRFLAALRQSDFSARDRALLAEPAIYEEYRASLARQETAREMSRRS